MSGKLRSLGVSIGIVYIALSLTSCMKEKCGQCYYTKSNGDLVKLGEVCGDRMESFEKDGYPIGEKVHEVTCEKKKIDFKKEFITREDY